MPLLRREDRRYQLQGYQAAPRLRSRARQDCSTPHFGRMRAAPAAGDGCDQEGAQHRAFAVRIVVLEAEETAMEVILREDVEKLGNRGEVVKVAPGYARNFLLPKKLAVAATGSNKKIVEQERQAHLKREAKVQADASELAKLMAGGEG